MTTMMNLYSGMRMPKFARIDWHGRGELEDNEDPTAGNAIIREKDAEQRKVRFGMSVQ